MGLWQEISQGFHGHPEMIPGDDRARHRRNLSTDRRTCPGKSTFYRKE